MAIWVLFSLFLAALAFADNDFTFTGTPVAGLPFNVTWTPGTLTQVVVLLNNLLDTTLPIITTSVQITAGSIPNSGSWVWDVPADIKGRFSLSIARDIRDAISFSQPFTFGPYTITSVTQVTSIPQSTACTSASSSPPVPTGVNPFLFPAADYTHVRVGVQNDIKWFPTTSDSVSLILHPESNSGPEEVTDIIIANNIPNSGSYKWTPDIDLASVNLPLLQYKLIIIDYGYTYSFSISDIFLCLSPSYPTDFIGPYPPAILGEPYQIKWSPSNAPTISLVLQDSAFDSLNITIGDHIKNDGSFTWLVPSASTFIVPGVWWLAAINDATGATDARIILVIDAPNPPTCGPAHLLDRLVTNSWDLPTAYGIVTETPSHPPTSSTSFSTGFLSAITTGGVSTVPTLTITATVVQSRGEVVQVTVERIFLSLLLVLLLSSLQIS